VLYNPIVTQGGGWALAAPRRSFPRSPMTRTGSSLGGIFAAPSSVSSATCFLPCTREAEGSCGIPLSPSRCMCTPAGSECEKPRGALRRDAHLNTPVQAAAQALCLRCALALMVPPCVPCPQILGQEDLLLVSSFPPPCLCRAASQLCIHHAGLAILCRHGRESAARRPTARGEAGARTPRRSGTSASCRTVSQTAPTSSKLTRPVPQSSLAPRPPQPAAQHRRVLRAEPRVVGAGVPPKRGLHR
jgi:hypothetical protein